MPTVPKAPEEVKRSPQEIDHVKMYMTQLEKRVIQLETEARARPYSTAETIARWSVLSGGDETLSRHQTEKDKIS